MESRVRKTQGLSARTSAVGFHFAIVGSSVVERSPYQNGLLRVIPGEPLRLKFGSSRIGSRSGAADDFRKIIRQDCQVSEPIDMWGCKKERALSTGLVMKTLQGERF